MAYIDYAYYTDVFHGTEIEQSDFDRLAELASDIIDASCSNAINETSNMELVKRATAYQVEYMNSRGDVSAAIGGASYQSVSESLDDYSISVSESQSAREEAYSLNGIPLSALAVALLKRAGLIASRWVYEGLRRPYAE